MKSVIKRLQFPLEIMLVCVRWYVAYPLSLRNLEEMMHERGVTLDHSTIHRWTLRLMPVLERTFRRAVKHITRPMLGFKSFRCARVTLGSIEIMHMICKGQLRSNDGSMLSAPQQFYSLAV
jgi:transposase-like protein